MRAERIPSRLTPLSPIDEDKVRRTTKAKYVHRLLVVVFEKEDGNSIHQDDQFYASFIATNSLNEFDEKKQVVGITTKAATAVDAVRRDRIRTFKR